MRHRRKTLTAISIIVACQSALSRSVAGGGGACGRTRAGARRRRPDPGAADQVAVARDGASVGGQALTHHSGGRGVGRGEDRIVDLQGRAADPCDRHTQRDGEGEPRRIRRTVQTGQRGHTTRVALRQSEPAWRSHTESVRLRVRTSAAAGEGAPGTDRVGRAVANARALRRGGARRVERRARARGCGASVGGTKRDVIRKGLRCASDG